MDHRNDVNRLMQQHGSQLLRLCVLLLRDADLAQDAVQETFLRAWRKYGTRRGEASDKTWLTAIAVNLCRDYRRGAWFRHIARETDIADLPEPRVDFTFPDSTVITEVMRLPDRLREVILLRYYQNMTQNETAAALHISDRAVRLRLQRANAILRERLKEWYKDEG
ncbi:MAG: sigma-70 family RNA polymerase sigma factor [Clostridia bacterium]|nr:sigma-70 family RNA polymerase sigma factor [Clostridia bacterium]